MSEKTKAVIFKKIPTEYPIPGEHFEVIDTNKNINTIKIGPDEVLLKVLYLSLDPYLRSCMRTPDKPGFAPPYKLGEPAWSDGIGEVVKSNNADYKLGEKVIAKVTWETYSVLKVNDRACKVPDIEGIPLTYWLGVLGMPGMTAYIGLHKIGNPKAGQTIFISSASGAVGTIVGQLAKEMGLKVVGSAGDDSKVNLLLQELNFDAAFNYKKEDTFEALKKYCPQGIDLYWENVGGKTLENVLSNCNNFARIIACGMISGYNTSNPEGVHNLVLIVSKRIRMEGFLVWDDWDQYWPGLIKDIPELLKKGAIKYKEDITEGLENAPEAFLEFLKGKKHGKCNVKVS
jgi:NADPH-dependent curcumin reductase CurA